MKQSRRIWRILVTLAVFVLNTSYAVAAEQNFYDRVQLSAEAVADAENDTLVAVLFAQQQGSDVAKLAAAVNQIMTRAIQRCKQVKAVEVRTLNYQTNPVYEKQHQTGWRISQSLELKSQDSHALGQLIGNLQETLMLESMSYEISPALRNKIEESLIGKAIASFSKRAQDITQHLGRKRYRLVRMQIDTAGVPRPPMQRQNFQAFAMDKAVSPAIEPGKQRITVTVDGVIELVLN